MSSKNQVPPRIVDDIIRSVGLEFLVVMNKNTTAWMSLETAYIYDSNMVHEYIQKNYRLMRYPEVAKKINGK